NRATGAVTTRIPLPYDQYEGVTGTPVASPDGSRLYVGIKIADALAVINTATNVVETTISLNRGHFAISPDGTRLYISQSSPPRVIVIDTATNTVQKIIRLDGFGLIGAMALSPDLPHLYVLTNTNIQTVTVIHTATYALLAPIPLGDYKYPKIAVTP